MRDTLWEQYPIGSGSDRDDRPVYDFGDASFAVACWGSGGTEFLDWHLADPGYGLRWSAPLAVKKAVDLVRRLLDSPVSLPRAVVIFSVADRHTLRIGLCLTKAPLDVTDKPQWFTNPKAGLGSYLPRPTRYELALESDEDD